MKKLIFAAVAGYAWRWLKRRYLHTPGRPGMASRRR